MSKYSKAYIYGIRCNTTNLLYIGSSIKPMKTRLTKHLTDLKGYLGINPRPRCYRSSFEVLMNNNYEMFKIEDYPCETKHELEIREGLHMIKNKGCVNKRLPCKLNLKDHEEVLSSLPSFI
tara:strand:+ start:144 stop:506 length:363 start_codon:yes stop_codon:yes gene_type:complete